MKVYNLTKAKVECFAANFANPSIDFLVYISHFVSFLAVISRKP